MDIPVHEGFIPSHGYKTWYRIVGEDKKDRLPLLCLHGGPGMTHDYLETLEQISQTGRRVIFYDQLGCGDSDHPHKPSMWTVELFVEELGEIRKALSLDEIHLFGQSWGGFLAQEYLLTKPSGIKSLILANSAASTQRWISEANRLRLELPPEIQQTLKEHEDAGTTDGPAYVSATDVYYRRHLCRLDPWPDCLNRSLEKLGQDPEVYNYMWGPTEFHCTGSLKNWDIEDRLGEIDIPALILSGRHDESTPAINEVLHQGIRESKWVVFEKSSHTPHLEETERYIQVVSDFLDRHS
ncbi:MAG TPA: proline iminopeptidase-family hydrolase [Anaerolineales bacterium]|nr:proline iminopeptidase-family hydrolase [Anaerolineales bacterium]